MHLSVALAGFDNIQLEQVQVLEPDDSGFFMPAPAQSNDLTVGAGGGVKAGAAAGIGADPDFEGRGASQMVHCSVAEPGLLKPHRVQVQPAPELCSGFFMPAALQSNAIGRGAAGAANCGAGAGLIASASKL